MGSHGQTYDLETSAAWKGKAWEAQKVTSRIFSVPRLTKIGEIVIKTLG